MGYDDEALARPLVAVVNTFTTATPGHFTLDELSRQVQLGIESAGGTAMSFGTIAPCDGIAEGHEGMRYILPSRDLIASSVECMVRAHRFDALVLLGSCDKIVPGLLMAAARLDVPALFLNAGPMLPATYRGRHWDGNIVTEAVGWKRRGEIGEAAFKAIENLAEPCAGSCAMLGTANTMCCLAEAMGMALPGTATIPAVMARSDAPLGARNQRPPADDPPLAGKRHGCAHGDGRLHQRHLAPSGHSPRGRSGRSAPFRL